jgi:hypothetical protein
MHNKKSTINDQQQRLSAQYSSVLLKEGIQKIFQVPLNKLPIVVQLAFKKYSSHTLIHSTTSVKHEAL